VNLLNRGFINKTSKLFNSSSMQTVVVFVLGTVDHIEIPTNQPWTKTNLS
jgi:hypothetical protein